MTRYRPTSAGLLLAATLAGTTPLAGNAQTNAEFDEESGVILIENRSPQPSPPLFFSNPLDGALPDGHCISRTEGQDYL